MSNLTQHAATGTIQRASLVRRQTVAVWVLWAVGLGSLAVAFLTARAGSPVDDPASTVAGGLTALSFITVGAVLVTRIPGQRIGWLLCVGGLLTEIGLGTGGLADNGLVTHPGSVPGAIWFASVNQATGLGVYGAVPIVAFLFPTGRLPSARWRPVAAVAIIAVVLFMVTSVFAPWPNNPYPVGNPLLAGGVAGDLLGGAGGVASVGLVAAFLVAAASILRRYRRARGTEREQLKWLAFAVSFYVAAFIGALVLDGVGNTGGSVPGTAAYDGWLVVAGAVGLLPVAIGIAVLRYRLYEIDRLISRTIGWAVVTAILGAVFVAVVLAVQAVLGPLTGSSTLAVAGSTLLVAALFQPIRRRVQQLVDRRFNRARYDADRTVAAFAGRLRDQVDLEHLGTEITGMVAATVQPMTVTIWLRG